MECLAVPVDSGTTFCWRSPDVITVSQHLSNTTGQSVVIKPNDYLYFSCYITHFSVIESLKSPHGTDTALQQSVDEWVSKYNDNNTDKLAKALLETITYVAHHLLMEKAILLSWTSKVFLQAYNTEVTGSVKSARVYTLGTALYFL